VIHLSSSKVLHSRPSPPPSLISCQGAPSD
jgi:hypothetical protein